MVDVVNKAFEAARKAQEAAYSGVPAVYVTHQEIVLELFERWA